MAKTRTRSAKQKPRVTQSEQERIGAHKALVRCTKREREIQRLSRQLMRLVETSNGELAGLANWIQDRALHGTMGSQRPAAVGE